MEKEFAFS